MSIGLNNQALILSSLINHANDTEGFKRLWNQATPAIKNYRDEQGLTWMCWAILNRKNELIDFFLEENIDIKTANIRYLETPLNLARRLQLDQSVIDKLTEIDNGFTDDIEFCKIFGHRFSLKGIFEGFPNNRTHVVIDQLLRSLYEFSSKNSHLFKPAQIFEIEDALKYAESSPEVLYERSLKDWTVVSSGWERHQTTCIFIDHIFVKVDTAAGLYKGLSFYNIKNLDSNRRKRAITTLRYNYTQQVGEKIGSHYFHKSINQDLGLELIGWLEYDQVVGNCVWSAYRATLLALFILKNIEIGKQPITENDLKMSFNNLSSSFDLWTAYDGEMNLPIAVSTMKKYPEIFDVAEIQNKLIKSFKVGFLKNQLIAMLK